MRRELIHGAIIAMVGITTLRNPDTPKQDIPRKIESRSMGSVNFELPTADLDLTPQIEVEQVVNPQELELLARLINAEAGANWCSDTMQIGVGSVALNRVNHPDYPNTLEEVIYQKGQYACIHDGNFSKEPTERSYEVALMLLTEGSQFPGDVVYQAGFKQGSEVYLHEQNMYFCRR